MMEKEKIRGALSELDPLNDDHWTDNGMALLSVLEIMLGEKVSRQDVVNAAPDFSRQNHTLKKEEEQENAEEKRVSEEGNEEGLNPSAQSLVDFGRPMTEREFASFLGSIPKEELEETVSLLRIQLSEVSKAVEMAKDFEGRVKRCIALAESRIKDLFPNSPEREAIRAFIDSQTRIRAERIERRRQIFSQIDVSDLDPRAPIDRAMARKTQRGGARPQRTLIR